MPLRLILSIVLVTFTTPLMATKPIPSDRSPTERDILEKLRFQKGDKKNQILKKLSDNLSRDCHQRAYSKKDFDLTVESITDTFPIEITKEYFTSEFLTICPPNFVTLLKKPWIESVRKKIARNYSLYFKGDQYWPYSHLNELTLIFDILGSDCTRDDVNAFISLFCRYNQQEGPGGWQKIYVERFEKTCPKFQSQRISCRWESDNQGK